MSTQRVLKIALHLIRTLANHTIRTTHGLACLTERCTPTQKTGRFRSCALPTLRTSTTTEREASPNSSIKITMATPSSRTLAVVWGRGARVRPHLTRRISGHDTDPRYLNTVFRYAFFYNNPENLNSINVLISISYLLVASFAVVSLLLQLILYL